MKDVLKLLIQKTANQLISFLIDNASLNIFSFNYMCSPESILNWIRIFTKNTVLTLILSYSALHARMVSNESQTDVVELGVGLNTSLHGSCIVSLPQSFLIRTISSLYLYLYTIPYAPLPTCSFGLISS